jgi:hypothetical protein
MLTATQQIRRLSLTADGMTVDIYNNDFNKLSLLRDYIRNEEALERLCVPNTQKHNGGKVFDQTETLVGGSGLKNTVPTGFAGVSQLVNNVKASVALRAETAQVREIVAGQVYEVEQMVKLSELSSFWRGYNHVSSKINYTLELELHTEQNGRNIIQQEATLGEFVQSADIAEPEWEWAENTPAFLLVRRVQPSSEKNADIRQSIVDGLTNTFSYQDSAIYRQPYADNTGGEVWRVTNSLSKILRIYVMFQLQDKSNSATQTSAIRTLDTQKLDRVSLASVQVKVGGMPFPSERYSLGYDQPANTVQTRGERLRAYHDFRRITGSDVTFSDWERVCPIFAFDVNVADSESGTNEIVVEWEKPTGVGIYNAYCVIDYRKECEVHMDNSMGSVRVIGSS